jgi:hypothetical protein
VRKNRLPVRWQSGYKQAPYGDKSMTEPEWLTRKQRIDAKLRSLSPAWEIVRYTAQEMSVWRETINHFDAIKLRLSPEFVA